MANDAPVPALIRHSDGTIEATCPLMLFSIDRECISEAFIDHSPDIFIRRRSRYSDTASSYPDGYCGMEHWGSKNTDVLQLYLPMERFDLLKQLVERATGKNAASMYLKFRPKRNSPGFVETGDFEIGIRI